jgi:hypothetical protein
MHPIDFARAPKLKKPPLVLPTPVEQLEYQAYDEESSEQEVIYQKEEKP